MHLMPSKVPVNLAPETFSAKCHDAAPLSERNRFVSSHVVRRRQRNECNQKDVLWPSFLRGIDMMEIGLFIPSGSQFDNDLPPRPQVSRQPVLDLYGAPLRLNAFRLVDLRDDHSKIRSSCIRPICRGNIPFDSTESCTACLQGNLASSEYTLLRWPTSKRVNWQIIRSQMFS